MKKKVFIASLMFLISIVLISCGGGGAGGGGVVTTFDTVTVRAGGSGVFGISIPLATEEDDTSCNDPVDTDNFTFTDTFQDFVITSERIIGLPSSVVSSQIRLERVTITFSPDPVSGDEKPAPALDAKIILPLTEVIEAPGVGSPATLTLELPIVTKAVKMDKDLRDLLCAENLTYKYTAKLIFEGVEVLTGNEGTWKTTFQVFFQPSAPAEE